MKQVAALCVRPGSVYSNIPGVECYDARRDALTFPGGLPVVAHPPCRLFGRLKAFAKVGDESAERSLAHFCVGAVRLNGGVLEHPAASSLFRDAGLPAPGCVDRHGFTFAVSQYWWGHAARKDSWFYICGISPRAMPAVPFRLEGCDMGKVESLSRKGREGTPFDLAAWLVEVARQTAANN